jgi:drug/metabolite transporter (DMT)-like permease
MKPQMVLGIVLAGVGAFIVLRGLNYGSDRSVMRVGEFSASVETRRAVPIWVGGVAIVGGLLLVGAGVRGRGRSA